MPLAKDLFDAKLIEYLQTDSLSICWGPLGLKRSCVPLTFPTSLLFAFDICLDFALFAFVVSCFIRLSMAPISLFWTPSSMFFVTSSVNWPIPAPQ